MQKLLKNKWLWSAVTFAFLMGCDSGSSSKANDDSSSSSVPVEEIPEPDPESAVVIKNFKSTATLGNLSFSGTASIDFDSEFAEDTTYLDSVQFIVTTALEGASGAKVSMEFFDFTEVSRVDFQIDLKAKLDLYSFEGCGEFKVFVLAYGDGKMSRDSLTFSKAVDIYCKEQVASSSSAAVEEIPFEMFNITLSTEASGNVAYDLDGGEYFNSGNLDDSKIDITLRISNGFAYLTLGTGAQVTSELNGWNPANLPQDPVYFSSFWFKPADFSSTLDDELTFGEAYVLKTSSYNESSKEGLFVLMPNTLQWSSNNAHVTVPIIIYKKQ